MLRLRNSGDPEGRSNYLLKRTQGLIKSLSWPKRKACGSGAKQARLPVLLLRAHTEEKREDVRVQFALPTQTILVSPRCNHVNQMLLNVSQMQKRKCKMETCQRRQTIPKLFYSIFLERPPRAELIYIFVGSSITIIQIHVCLCDS